jgi:allantoicase
MNRRTPVALLVSLLAPLAAAGCGSSAASGPVGGPVTGAVDDHCFMNDALMKAKIGVCETPGASDAGAPDGGAVVPEMGEPLFNSEGYDDDCKYHVSWTSTPIRKNELVTFTVTLEGLDPAGPVKGADIDTDVFMGDTIVAPNTGSTSTESPADSGTYKVGPIKFTQSGEWVVELHFFEECSDEPADSPHGHIGFRINVP